jgi:small subunit ribosomal protein S18
VRKKVCRLCENKVTFIDFKDVDLLRRYQTEGGKILPRRITGNCFKHQKMLTAAVKRARILALVL